ncbi:MAG TPA: efflux RND transporter periplasmic adaptor subunit [Terriglobales bacterium]|nr:efflux RND transporter periplasmic adaptor subunit [Terriglobales bacterium]
MATFVLSITFFALGCSRSEEKQSTPAVSVQAATVKTQTIEDEISTDAILYPRDESAIVPRVAGPIRKFYVSRGSRVHAGEVVATIEDSDLKGALTESQGAYQQAQATYNSATQSAEHDLKIAKEQFDAAQSLYDSRVTLYKQGAAAQKDVQDAQIALSQASNQYDLAKKQYNLKLAEGQLTSARGRLASAQAQVDYGTIVSPINGVVTDRPFFAGDTPPAGAPILTVMDLSKVVARAYLTAAQATQLRVGDPASLLAGNADTKIEGKVTVVSPALDPNSTTVQVWVEAPNPGGRLKPGSTVGVKIVARTVKDALVVPAEAVLTATDGATSVMVIGQDQVAHRTIVKTGIRQDGEVQVLSGLKAGDQVVTQGAYGLSGGAKVTIAKPADLGAQDN